MFFTPLKIKTYKIKNRSVMAPMCMYMADEEGFAQTFHNVHYGSRALGGLGIVIQEATAISKEGRISLNDLGIWDDAHIEGLKNIASSIKNCGSIAGIQINHAGRKSKTNHPMGPSAIPFYDYPKPKEMTIEDIKETIQNFKNAARRAHMAGYDLLEIHGAHGYLIFEFLSPLSNQRDDHYKDGVIFLEEVIRAIQEEWPKEKILALRISAHEYHENGVTSKMAANIINRVKHLGLDIIDVSSGGNVRVNIEPYPGYQVKFAEEIKKSTQLLVIAGGLITDLKLAEYVLKQDQADMIFFGRVLLREPQFILNHAKEIGYDLEWPKAYQRGR
jgi:NADPH2 dehydrogenase